MKKITIAFIGAILFISPVTLQAQLLNRLKNKAENKAVNKADVAMGKAISGSPKKEEKAAVKSAKTQEQPVSIPVKDTLPAAAQDDAFKTYSKFDFVPGEKVIYAEDFSQDNIGEFPVNWNTGANGVVMKLGQSPTKWLKLASGVYLSGNKASSFGKDFTIEFDVFLNAEAKTGYHLPPVFFGVYASGKDDQAHNKFLSHQNVVNSFQVKIDPKPNENTMSQLRSYEKGAETFHTDKKIVKYGTTLRKLAHYAIAVQGTRLRIWINEEKIYDVPRAVNTSVPLNQLYFKTENSGGYNDNNFDYLVSNIKIATGYPDTRSKLVTEGKYVTTGILFDTGSDRIKAESYGTLKEIAGVLQENPGMNIKITGHTDADGNAAANLDLSTKRADAVKRFLIKEFTIDAARMQTDGKGATQPVADNTTVAGKASNRRVEFTKL